MHPNFQTHLAVTASSSVTSMLCSLKVMLKRACGMHADTLLRGAIEEGHGCTKAPRHRNPEAIHAPTPQALTPPTHSSPPPPHLEHGHVEGVGVDAVVRGDGVLKADVGAVPRARDLLWECMRVERRGAVSLPKP